MQDLIILHVSYKSSNDPTGAPLIIGHHGTIDHTAILHGYTVENIHLVGMGSLVIDKAVVQKSVLG